jgi:hypothetical protein
LTRLALPLAIAFAAAPAVADAQSVSGGIELSFGQMSFDNTDTEDSDHRGTLAVAGHVALTFGDWRATIDANHVTRDTLSGVEFDDDLPEGATALGLHVGRNLGATYVGGFVGINSFQGADAEDFNGFVDGQLFGIEVEQKTSFGSLFAQLGSADMVGDEGDTAFDGIFGMVGIAANFGPGTIIATFEMGESPDIYEDSEDSGTYKVIGITYEHPFNDRLIGTVGVQVTDFNANTEDAGTEQSFSLGLRVPLGPEKARNNLKTTYMPGLAAAWAEALD